MTTLRSCSPATARWSWRSAVCTWVPRGSARRSKSSTARLPWYAAKLFDHILLGTVVTVAPDGTHAAARSTQLGQLGMVGKGAQWELGVFENRFVKEGGKWRRSRACTFFQRAKTDYDKGWAVDSMPVPTAEAALAPDRGPSQSYATFPEAAECRHELPAPGHGQARGYAGRPGGEHSAGCRIDLHRPRWLQRWMPRWSPTLQRQLRVAVGVDATENLMSSYGWYIDESDWNNMAEDLWGSRRQGTLGCWRVCGNRAHPQGADPRVVRPRGPQSDHLHHSPGGAARDPCGRGWMSAKARLRLFQDGGAANGTSGSWIGGIYENTASFENGQWKVRHPGPDPYLQRVLPQWLGASRWCSACRRRTCACASRSSCSARWCWARQFARCARRRSYRGNRWHVDGQLVEGFPAGPQDPRAPVHLPGNRRAGIPLHEPDIGPAAEGIGQSVRRIRAVLDGVGHATHTVCRLHSSSMPARPSSRP